MALIGVAGTTETGTVDPLNEMADIASRFDCHFHVDAAWGGASMLSRRGAQLLCGIEKADSVTIDAHKQMYVPMGAGMVLFKNPKVVDSVRNHANYIIRPGSKDLGRDTLEGSRSGIALLVHACLHIIGRKGYEQLIDNSLDMARHFADLIKADDDFELASEPELCLLTYRYVPATVQAGMQNCNANEQSRLNLILNSLTESIQNRQSQNGQSFVSRTRLRLQKHNNQDIVVFRVVLANPLTTPEMLEAILAEQKTIANEFLEMSAFERSDMAI